MAKLLETHQKNIEELEAALLWTSLGLSDPAKRFRVSENDLLQAICERGQIVLCDFCGCWQEVAKTRKHQEKVICSDCSNS